MTKCAICGQELFTKGRYCERCMFVTDPVAIEELFEKYFGHLK